MQTLKVASIEVPLHADTMTLEVSADAEGVELGKSINNDYAVDQRLTADQAIAYAAAIQEAAIQCRAMQAARK